MGDCIPSSTEDIPIRHLLDYCTEKEIYINPNITPKRIPGRGVGIYATKHVKKGEQLMHVPVSAIVTTDSIPPKLTNTLIRAELSVHGQLAAYLAYTAQHKEGHEYERWMATWPSLTDFTTSMPMFWPMLRDYKPDVPQQDIESERPQKIRKLSANGARVNVSPDYHTSSSISGATKQITNPSKPDLMANTTTDLAKDQLDKLHDCINKIHKHIPNLTPNIKDPTHPDHWKFIHMWCSVNTRCFYYLKPNQKPPEDSNEAMALCPGMDLFNHADITGCITKYNETGYSIETNRDYEPGEEILLSYGPHSNDVLWTEYGFLLSENKEDAIRLDDFILSDITDDQRQMLDDADYLDDYWLRSDGVCWRTEAVAWIQILDSQNWERMMKGDWPPDDDKSQVNRKKLERGSDDGVVNGEGKKDWLADLDRRAEEKIRDWIVKVQKEDEMRLGRLEEMSDKDIIEVFGDTEEILLAQGIDLNAVGATRRDQARQRHQMCVQNSKQRMKICSSAMMTLEQK